MSRARRQKKWIELERLREAIRNAQEGLGITLLPDDIRLAGNTVPDIDLPKTIQ
ncbi:hypothetical protein [Aureimonas sp. Leaf454]|uniref:hypothetical protein n=1 Tax=Aureimonas sp. Leaf454 TaxID=1736381 RepID=UPI000AE789D2|nr:hypothetical protein [Aureimonas sp. Leaf454]